MIDFQKLATTIQDQKIADGTYLNEGAFRYLKIPLKGTRIHHTTKIKRQVDLLLSLEWIGHSQFIQIHNGVTGYESMYLQNYLEIRKENRFKEWHACAGTNGVWDELIITWEEIDKALKRFGVKV